MLGRRKDFGEEGQEDRYNDRRPVTSQTVASRIQKRRTYGRASRASASSCSWVSMNLEKPSQLLTRKLLKRL